MENVCHCGKVAKSKAGLVAHQRSCAVSEPEKVDEVAMFDMCGEITEVGSISDSTLGMAPFATQDLAPGHIVEMRGELGEVNTLTDGDASNADALHTHPEEINPDTDLVLSDSALLLRGICSKLREAISDGDIRRALMDMHTRAEAVTNNEQVKDELLSLLPMLIDGDDKFKVKQFLEKITPQS